LRPLAFLMPSDWDDEDEQAKIAHVSDDEAG
jgi:hypothetical protein